MATKIEILKLQQFKLAILLGTQSQEYLQTKKEIEKQVKREIEKEFNNDRTIK
jgi:hypothetical protein